MANPARTAVALLALLPALIIGACGDEGSQLGPPTPTGATSLGGPPMTSAPPPPPGWKLEPAIPASQQQAQDTVIGYLTKTLQTLAPGTLFDATRYRVGNGNRACDDTPTGPGKPEMMFTDVRQAILSSGTDPATAIRQAGDGWRSWGWYVVERDDFAKPNQFGYGPDGYRLQIESSTPAGHPPTISGMSPCFPGDVARDDIPVPVVLRGS